MVVAKHAIFVYYLFDRHWTRPDVEWRYLVDDFAASFGISRHSVLESVAFYLLDDHSDQALQEATHILTEIAGPETHPKIAQILLERQRPDVALTILRCSGRDDGFTVYPEYNHDSLPCISLNEAITAIRVRLVYGLLTESFMYQRMHCSKVKELTSRKRSTAFSSISKLDSWAYQLEVLVTEICQLCIRRNLVDRMIELPWNSDEEKFLHKCLFGHACQNPASIYGSLLVAFYLQRCRYVESYQLDRKLQSLEQSFTVTANDDIICRINSISHWRSGLVEKSLELLPEARRRQAMAESTVDGTPFSLDVQRPVESDCTHTTNPVSILIPTSAKTPLILQKSTKYFPSRKSPADAPIKFTTSISNAQSETDKREPSVLQNRILSSLYSPAPRMNSFLDGVPLSNHYNIDLTSEDTDKLRQNRAGGFSLPSSESKATVRKMHQNGHQFHAENAVKLRSVAEHSDSFYRITAESQSDLMDMSQSKEFMKESTRSRQPRISHNFLNRNWSEATPNTRSSLDRASAEASDTRVGSRWRSDESSADEADHGLDSQMHDTTPLSGRRRAIFSRR